MPIILILAVVTVTILFSCLLALRVCFFCCNLLHFFLFAYPKPTERYQWR